ncbi:hypothetical protein FACS189447_10750 [Spirochaetia bacterium]|nr:hypothetical protein FACS189447_10750 [Spirochaetia bacterium]
MCKEEFLEKIKNKPIYGIKSIYAYFLDFEIGEPYLKIDELRKTTVRFRKYEDRLKFDQVYYDAQIKGEIHFSTEVFWKLKMKNKVICDANVNHSEIEHILNFLLTGHSIKDIEIIKDKRNIVKILFSNNFILYVTGKGKKCSDAWFSDKEYCAIFNGDKGYRYCLMTDSSDEGWIQ